MINKFLVSFCNNKKNIGTDYGTGIIGLFEFKNNKIVHEKVSLELPFLENINGATGLASCQNFIYVVLQSKFSKLLILNHNLSVHKLIDLKPYKGVHSLLYFENSLYMVVTKQDKVIKFNLDNKFETIYELGANNDTHHINSICRHKGEIYISAFGNNEKEFWMDAKDGYILNLDKNKIIMSNLKQPHSLFSFNDLIYVCDSSRKRIIDENNNVLIQNDHGYTRGLYLTNKMICFGVSKGRKVSYSQNKYIGNISDKGTLSGDCGISFVFNNKKIDFSLSNIAEEIYDVVPYNTILSSSI